MEELALTAQRLLSVWWLILWRGSLGGWILGFVAGGIAGFIVGAIGHPELAAVAGGYAGLLGTADRSHGPQEAIQRFFKSDSSLGNSFTLTCGSQGSPSAAYPSGS
jgi:hypothetical protein